MGCVTFHFSRHPFIHRPALASEVAHARHRQRELFSIVVGGNCHRPSPTPFNPVHSRGMGAAMNGVLEIEHESEGEE